MATTFTMEMSKLDLTNRVGEAWAAMHAALNRKARAIEGIKNAKRALIDATTQATQSPEFRALTNDKQRDAFVRLNYPKAFQDLADAEDEQINAQNQYEQAELNMQAARLLVQIWCPYLPFAFGGA